MPCCASPISPPEHLHHCRTPPQTAQALGCSTADYRLSALRYDLSKLRAKSLVENLPHSRRYCLLPNGYRICLVFLKLFERIYAPLTAGLLRPFPADNKSPSNLCLSSTDSTNASPTPLTISFRPSASKPPDYACNENRISVTLWISN